MRHQTLREIAKFASGLIAADFLCWLWFWGSGMLPIQFMGATFSADMVLPALIFDAAVFAALVHYGWHAGHIPSLRERTYLIIAGVIFAIVAIVHLVRIFTNANVAFFGWDVPMGLSWLGVIVTAYLAYMSFHLAVRMKISRRK